jgi:uncharacterized protein YjbI with pentapeptide repeats
MKIVKPQRIALLYKPYEYLGQFRLAVTAALYFPFSQPDYLLPEIAMWKLVGEKLGKDAPLDLCVPKPKAEVLVIGDCYAPPGQTQTRGEVRVSLGAAEKPLLDKRLIVWGDREWTRGLAGAKPGPAKPYARMPIDWAHAFGGPDFPENPVGKGAAASPPDANGIVVHPLPNIEDPAQPIVLPDDRPPPAGLSVVDFVWPQRAKKAGTYDDAWLRTRFPGFADDIDMSMFNAAPRDQWLPRFMAGDEPFEISGMHPEQPRVGGRLPGAAVRCLLDRGASARDRYSDIAMRAETLWLFPREERAILVFRGDASVTTDDATDIVNLLVAAEPMQAPRSSEYYQDALEARLDPRNGALLALRDDQLLPPQPQRTAALPDDDGADTWMYTLKGHQAKRLRALSEREFARGRAQLADARAQLVAKQQELLETKKRPEAKDSLERIDAAAATITASLAEIDEGIAKMVLPPEEPPASLEELPALKKKLIAEAKKAQEEAKVKLAAAEQATRDNFSRMNEELAKVREQLGKLEKLDPAAHKDAVAKIPGPIDWDAAKQEAIAKAGGPPKPFADKVVAQIRDADAQIKGVGARIPDKARSIAATEPGAAAAAAIKAAEETAAKGLPVDIEKFGKQMHESEARVMQTYRSSAHMMLPAAPLSGDAAASARSRVAAAHAARQPLAGVDLTGADLSGMDLTGIDFRDALLEAVDFSGSTLAAGKLSGAVLARARFTGAKLQRADFAKANLGFADFSDADVTDAELSGANLSNAQLANANFTGAKMVKANLLGAKMNGANFTRVVAPSTNFLNVDLSMPDEPPPVDFEPEPAPDLDMTGAIFTGADLQNSNFVNCIVAGIDFSGANLSGCNFIAAKGNGCRFSGAQMTNVRMVMNCSFAGCDFTGARLDAGHLCGVDLANGAFAGCSAIGTDFTRSLLSRADLRKVAARGARFTKADLTLARMEGIDLMDGVLQKATLHGTRLQGANLLGADLLRIKTDEGTDFSRANLKRTLAGAVEKK